MKADDLIAMAIAAIVPFAALVAQELDKSGKGAQNREESSNVKNGKSLGAIDMGSEMKSADSKLDKVIAEMNAARLDKKIDANVSCFEQTGRAKQINTSNDYEGKSAQGLRTFEIMRDSRRFVFQHSTHDAAVCIEGLFRMKR
jgi:hypothetical protein